MTIPVDLDDKNRIKQTVLIDQAVCKSHQLRIIILK